MTTTSSNIVETFASIPLVVASEMRIDFLVQKAVVHNYLRIPQSTFPLLYSRVQMESSRSSTQTMTTTSSNIVKTIAWIPFYRLNSICRSLRNEDWFPGAKGCCSQFFEDSAKYVSIATLQSSNGIKTFFYSNNDDDFFQHRWNFRLNTICRSLINEDWFRRAKGCCSQFFADSAKYVSIATLQSSNGIKTFFYSNNDDDFFQHRWNFRLNTICRSLRNDDWFTGPKDCCSQFFADCAIYVSIAIVHSLNGIKPFFFSNNHDDFF